MCGSRPALILLAVGVATLPPRSLCYRSCVRPLAKKGEEEGTLYVPPLPHNCVIRHSRTRRKTYEIQQTKHLPKARVGGLLCVSRALAMEWLAERRTPTIARMIALPQIARLADVWFTPCAHTSSSRSCHSTSQKPVLSELCETPCEKGGGGRHSICAPQRRRPKHGGERRSIADAEAESRLRPKDHMLIT